LLPVALALRERVRRRKDLVDVGAKVLDESKLERADLLRDSATACEPMLTRVKDTRYVF
jgi:hypothetical protein